MPSTMVSALFCQLLLAKYYYKPSVSSNNLLAKQIVTTDRRLVLSTADSRIVLSTADSSFVLLMAELCYVLLIAYLKQYALAEKMEKKNVQFNEGSICIYVSIVAFEFEQCKFSPFSFLVCSSFLACKLHSLTCYTKIDCSHLKNQPANTRLAYTHLNTFFMRNPNEEMEI